MKTITNKILCMIITICILAFSAFALAPPGNPPAGEKTVKSKTVKSDPAGKTVNLTVETSVAAEAAAETNIIESAARESKIWLPAADMKLELQYKDDPPDIGLNRQTKREPTDNAFRGFGACNNARAKI